MLSSDSGKQWKLIAATVSVTEDGKTETSNWMKGWKACHLDDLYIFFADKKYEQREGASKCYAIDKDLITHGTWELKNNDTELRVDTDLWKILELSDNTIKLENTHLGNISKIVLTKTYQAN